MINFIRRNMIVSILLLSFTLLIVTACNPGGNDVAISPVGFTITIADETIIETDILVNEEVLLTSNVIPANANGDVLWKSSEEGIATISDNGLLKGIGEGTALITATSKVASQISKSIFVNVSLPREQTAVGSGKSIDDPLFIGNEGKDEPLEIYFLETYHIYADSIYIKKGDVDIIIDAGYEFDGLVNNAFITEQITDRRLDLLIASHSDGDHIDGMQNILKGIEDVSLIVDYGGSDLNNAYKQKISTFINDGTPYYSAIDSANAQNGAVKRWYITEEFYFDVLNTGSYISSGSNAGNAASLATIFYYKDFSFFTAGDITTSTEAALLRNEVLPNVTLYKASHHGSHGSNSQAFMDVLNPKAVAITASRAGTYGAAPSLEPIKERQNNLNAAGGHPAAAAINRIYQIPNISSNLNVYWNPINGRMKFSTKGSDSFTFEGSEALRGYYDLSVTNNVPVWNDELGDFENKVKNEEQFKLHETKVFEFRNYAQYLPTWAKEGQFVV